jgi:uncharacterized protein YukE
MSFLGMELEAAMHQASLLQTKAVEELVGIIERSDSLVTELSGSWKGPDADRFVQTWETAHKAALTRVQQALSGFHTDLTRNIAAQQQASDG